MKRRQDFLYHQQRKSFALTTLLNKTAKASVCHTERRKSRREERQYYCVRWPRWQCMAAERKSCSSLIILVSMFGDEALKRM
jgi:hypothetical protein